MPNAMPRLYIACRDGHTETATALLAAGAAVNQAEDDGASPLFITCYFGHTEIVAALLGAGVAVDQATNDGASPLFVACQHGHKKIAAALLDAGAAVDQATKVGLTPLAVACHLNHQSIVELLTSYGASCTFVIKGQQMTAEDVAASNDSLRAWLERSRQSLLRQSIARSQLGENSASPCADRGTG